MPIKNEIVEELLKGADPKKVFSIDGLLEEIKKALAERMPNAELDGHLQKEATGRLRATRVVAQTTATATARRL